MTAELGAEYKCPYYPCQFNDLSSASWNYETPEFTADFTSGTLSMTLDLIPTVEITTTVGYAGVVTATASSSVGFTVRHRELEFLADFFFNAPLLAFYI